MHTNKGGEEENYLQHQELINEESVYGCCGHTVLTTKKILPLRGMKSFNGQGLRIFSGAELLQRQLKIAVDL